MDIIEQPFSKKVVRLVQPNAVQEKKWDPRFAPIYFKKLLSLSSKQPNENLDLIVWPETAIVPWLNEASKELEMIGDSIPLGADLILGIRSYEKNKIFNSLILLSNDGVVKAKYDKYHLVPFGEYIPVLRFLSDNNILFEKNYDTFGFSSGSGAEILSSKIGLIRPLICYEAIFFQEIDNNPRPNFLVNLTNDGWLGSWAGPEQHLQQVRMRAIEQGLPVIRSANTGISAVIDPYGNVIDRVPLGSDGYVDVILPSRLNETLYSKLGETLFLISLFLWFLVLLVFRKKL
jgi:apolipoprotein N-acyltransferase